MKKIIAVLVAFAVFSVVFPTFAKSTSCAVCHGSGKIIYNQTVPAFNYSYDRKTGRNIRVPPYTKLQTRVSVCPGCRGKGHR